eukprot:m.377209 g.377209  ORF g.377209 m.377209 type:complete len:51 (-) comp85931_c0_seq1:15-167(-)
MSIHVSVLLHRQVDGFTAAQTRKGFPPPQQTSNLGLKSSCTPSCSVLTCV